MGTAPMTVIDGIVRAADGVSVHVSLRVNRRLAFGTLALLDGDRAEVRCAAVAHGGPGELKVLGDLGSDAILLRVLVAPTETGADVLVEAWPPEARARVVAMLAGQGQARSGGVPAAAAIRRRTTDDAAAIARAAAEAEAAATAAIVRHSATTGSLPMLPRPASTGALPPLPKSATPPPADVSPRTSAPPPGREAPPPRPMTGALPPLPSRSGTTGSLPPLPRPARTTGAMPIVAMAAPAADAAPAAVAPAVPRVVPPPPIAPAAEMPASTAPADDEPLVSPFEEGYDLPGDETVPWPGLEGAAFQSEPTVPARRRSPKLAAAEPAFAEAPALVPAETTPAPGARSTPAEAPAVVRAETTPAPEALRATPPAEGLRAQGAAPGAPSPRPTAEAPPPPATAERLAAAPPAGLVAPERMRLPVYQVPLPALVAALSRQRDEAVPILELAGVQVPGPPHVIVLRVVTRFGPVLFEATSLPVRGDTVRVRLGPIDRETRAWLEEQT